MASTERFLELPYVFSKYYNMVRLKNTSQYYYKKILAVYEKFYENLQQFFENIPGDSYTIF